MVGMEVRCVRKIRSRVVSESYGRVSELWVEVDAANR
jgi:hypothetical protein